MNSNRIIPILFLNLGGEMLYILDQRLRSQIITQDKIIKVMDDIISIMLNDRFLNELFKPQIIYNKKMLRQIFEDLAHVSIMKLNKTSMDKLYDLMNMTFKYQVFKCKSPNDILQITFNHLDAIREFAQSSILHSQLNHAYSMFHQNYCFLTKGELQKMKYSLLSYFQDLKIPVSLLLKQDLQNSDGTFIISKEDYIPFEYSLPGKISYFSNNGTIKLQTNFNSISHRYKRSTNNSNNRFLGKNMYIFNDTVTKTILPQADQMDYKNVEGVNFTNFDKQFNDNKLDIDKEELTVLIKQLQGNVFDDDIFKETIWLNVSNDVSKENKECDKKTENFYLTINNTFSQKYSKELNKIFGEMEIDQKDNQKSNEPEDLLELLNL